jgi:nucleoid-associated protein YejK
MQIESNIHEMHLVRINYINWFNLFDSESWKICNMYYSIVSEIVLQDLNFKDFVYYIKRNIYFLLIKKGRILFINYKYSSNYIIINLLHYLSHYRYNNNINQKLSLYLSILTGQYISVVYISMGGHAIVY